MMEKKQTRTLLIFYLLAIYVILQFSWWAYYLVNLHKEILELKLSLADSNELRESLQTTYHKKVWMILGEGSVFIFFLLVGIWKVQSNLRKEGRLVRLQHNFLLSVTHEIKTPIASIRLLLETISKRKMEEEQRNKILQSSLEETDRLDALSDKILLATRIESKGEGFFSEEIDFSEFIRKLAEDLSSTIGSRHKLNLSIDNGIFLSGDVQALRSIFVNLFENACKYAPRETEIRVELKKDQNHAVLTIQDEGPGIAPEDEKRIFEKFFRSGDENTRTSKGTGLGLYIVKELTEQMNASLSYRPNKPHGAIFAVKFNLK